MEHHLADTRATVGTAFAAAHDAEAPGAEQFLVSLDVLIRHHALPGEPSPAAPEGTTRAGRPFTRSAAEAARPRRCTIARPMAAPCRGDMVDEVMTPTGSPSHVTGAPAAGVRRRVDRHERERAVDVAERVDAGPPSPARGSSPS